MANYYTSHNAAGGGAGTVGDPYTLQEGLDTVGGGDILHVMDTGTYTPSAGLVFDLNSDVNTNGSLASPIEIFGANSSGVVDGSVPVISGSSLPLSTNLFTYGDATIDIDYCFLKNLRFTQATNVNVYSHNAASSEVRFDNVRIDTADDIGMFWESNGTIMVNCEIDNNGSHGRYWGSTSTNVNGTVRMYNCSFHDNGGHGLGINNAGGNFLVRCLFYDNANDGLIFSREHGSDWIINCTFDGNTGDGLGTEGSVTGAGNVNVFNSIFSNNGGYGINWFASRNPKDVNSQLNWFYNNGTGSQHRNNWVTGINDTDGVDPQFKSRTDGSEDFEPASGSGLIDAGLSIRSA